MPEQQVLFDDRFLDRHAGNIIASAEVAIVELVANAWDAYATRVDIVWPDVKSKTPFSILDNGSGMSAAEFSRRWKTLDYNRLREQGSKAEPPPQMLNAPDRPAYGRNGRGRHAALKFSDPYIVTTVKDGLASTFRVKRDAAYAFAVDLVKEIEGRADHGTLIQAETVSLLHLTAEEAREAIGIRFLADPNFVVTMNGTKISFDDITSISLNQHSLHIDGVGEIKIIVLDTLKPDKTVRQHGIAWRVNNRLVGSINWQGFYDERILDGRTAEAKRFLVIILADPLQSAVLADWTGFDERSSIWRDVKHAVHAEIKKILNVYSADRRRDRKETVKKALSLRVDRLSPSAREKWNLFVDQVVDLCPSINANEMEQVSSVLANLELSESQYSLIDKLDALRPDELDELNKILGEWTLRSAKIALNEIQNRLRLVAELDAKLRDPTLEEVTHLQPLFERALWVFGPEFESIEYTSNKGMTTVIRGLLKQDDVGSLKRADFVVLPDGAVSLFSRDAFDDAHETMGPAHVVIVEIKKVGVPIGNKEKMQPWGYCKELRAKGALKAYTKVSCFVLGSEIEEGEAGDVRMDDGRCHIRALDYTTFVKRAEARLLGLRKKLADAPFLQEQGFDAEAFVSPSQAQMMTV